jgi:hypothetical protein
MSCINEYLLKKILSFEDHESSSYLFINSSPELIYQINEFLNSLNNPNIITLSISTGELCLPNINKLTGIDDSQNLDIFKKMLYQNLLVGSLLLELYNKYPNLKLFKYNKDTIKEALKESLKDSYSEINPDNLLFIYLLEYAAKELKKLGISLIINIYISKDNNIILQKLLNELLNDRHSYKTRFFTPESELITYFDDNEIMQEETHDYHLRNLKGITFSKQK